ncbi:MAG: GAF domain-containing protein [Nitriliruptor sp.]|nr:MAG: GAF domain-containing protein [Nitriliruptor sp.]
MTAPSEGSLQPVSAQPGPLVSGRSVVWLGPLAVVALASYAAVVGITNLIAFLILAVIAILVTAVLAVLPSRWFATIGWAQRVAEPGIIAASASTPVLLFAFVAFVLDGPVLPVGLVVAMQILAAAYTLPRPLRLPFQCWAVAAYLSGLWVRDVRSGTVWTLQVLGLVAVILLTLRAVERQEHLAAAAQRSREQAAALDELLTSVLRVNSLDPQAVLTAVVDGLEAVGFALVEIRRADADNNVARLIAGARTGSEPIQQELPLDRGLLGEVLDRREPINIDEVDQDPRVHDHGRGFRGAMVVPLPLGDGGQGVLSAVSTDGPVTPLQREAVERLVDHAQTALRRATAFEADSKVVEDLRRLEERTQDFVSTASHELRTPLTVIAGLGQTLQRHWEDLDAGRRADLLQRVEANADRLSVMVRSLLDTSALDRGELDLAPGPLPLRATILRLLDRLATVTAAHPITVMIDEDIRVLVDGSLFEHVIENLLTNVAKHTPQGTSVTIGADDDGTRAHIYVEDHGPGIDPEDLPHVLDRFYRGGAPTRRETGGLGLGLALAQQIVHAHGSELAVDSDPEVGTTFRFTVPLA